MNDAFFMRRFECIGNLLCVAEGSLKRERPFKHLLRNQLHH
jgi:hypothetical protein